IALQLFQLVASGHLEFLKRHGGVADDDQFLVTRNVVGIAAETDQHERRENQHKQYEHQKAPVRAYEIEHSSPGIQLRNLGGSGKRASSRGQRAPNLRFAGVYHRPSSYWPVIPRSSRVQPLPSGDKMPPIPPRRRSNAELAPCPSLNPSGPTLNGLLTVAPAAPRRRTPWPPFASVPRMVFE